jgi:predicted transposase YbfD/YdcC
MTMTERPTAAIEAHFGNVEDPRVAYLVIHPLINIITIALCAIIAGADNWSEVATFGERRKEWLGRFLDLRQGTPAHDTFSNLFGMLDPGELQNGFLSWVQAVHQRVTGEVVAVDGKKLRHSFDTASGQPMITMVNAWASEAELVLGQLKVTDESNEITAIPALLRLLDLHGCIITIDAIGCQRDIATQIVEQGADYLLAVKSNQEQLYEDIELFFRLSAENGFAKVNHTHARSVNKGHGRIEVRDCWAISGEESLQFLRAYEEWPRLQTIVRIDSERHLGDKVSRESRFFISSLPNDAEHLLHVKRSHWTIENKLHWVLDIAFREDDSRVRLGHGAENLASLRHMAVNLLKQENSAKGGIHNKRLQAAWDEDYLVKVLSGSMR